MENNTISIQLEDKVIEVKPEMTIGQYQKFYKNVEMYKKDPTQLLALYLDVPLYELRDLPKGQVEFVQQYLTQQLLNQTPKDETQFMFTYEGVTYGLESDWSKLTWGQWVDLEVYSSDNVDEHIHQIMSLLYRPVLSVDKKNKYKLIPFKSSDVEERAELFKSLPFSYWLGVSSFFFLIAQMYTNNIQSSLSMMSKTNRMIVLGWRILPKWIRNKLPLDSILLSPTNSAMRTSPSLNK